MDQLKQPPEMNFSAFLAGESLPERWRKWKQTTELYINIAMSKKNEEEKCATFLYVIGSEGREIFNTFQIEDANKNKLDPLIKAFDSYCKPKENLTVERYRFNTRSQGKDEPFDRFITDLRVLAQNCKFLQ